MEKPSVTVDARGLTCPGPLTNLIKAYRKANVGDIIEVLATDPGFKPDLEAWARRTENEIISVSEEGGVIRALIRVKKK
ncbi:sulfurtransferase TusA family protein [Candidatus Korarchaeum cryptofilum]|uniref:Sulfurtransferase TusA family protein n=1 Tax=Candidatus Korarchaeum cryptofilum TaxID=498846 RepID=A0A429G856_9CREN|nr:sulfurtransferase TusA family protein [Candidatus Korarchaeum cryptofilum]MCC6028940.1 sulfurtransferase TusA family protein [Candidatus Korarchaeum sp.]RSN70027.1 sulfurtransferase TusA family protein [Candidatus Korarchaeum cryptofilum]